MSSAVLFSEMTPDAEWEAEFNDWYDQEHIPVRMTLPEFTGAQRYKRNDRNYLAVYDMTGLEALENPDYVALKTQPTARTERMLRDVTGFTRYIGNEISCAVNPASTRTDWIEAPVLYPVLFDVPQDRLQEFDDWYDQDHVPILLECADWWAVRRFDLRIADPNSFNRLALHYLGNASALESAERQRARDTDWRKRLATEPWFRGTYTVFDAIGTRFHPTQ